MGRVVVAMPDGVDDGVVTVVTGGPADAGREVFRTGSVPTPLVEPDVGLFKLLVPGLTFLLPPGERSAAVAIAATITILYSAAEYDVRPCT